MKAVDGLIDMGIDVLQALQFSADGMDPRELKARAGKRLCFEGGVSVQTTLPFGSEEQVVEEVRGLIEVLGAGGGYILAPGAHAENPKLENLMAIAEAVNEYGYYSK